MAKKKLKHPVPTAKQLWEDARALLQYACRFEEGDQKIMQDETLQVMLSEVHRTIQNFKASRDKNLRARTQTRLISAVAKVYEKVIGGKITNEREYAYAFVSEGVAAEPKT